MVAAATTQCNVGNDRHPWRHRIDLQDAGRVDHRACHVGAVAGRVADRRPVQVERGHRKVAGVIAGANRVTEGQRIAAGAAGVARRTAIVERQRRHPAGNRHHLTHVDGERDDMARIQVTIAAPVDSAARCRNRWHRWRHRIDLQDAGRVDHRACHVGAVAGRVADRRPVQVERGHRKVAGVIAGANRVTEGQRIAAGAAGVARRTAIVERQRRHPAGNRHHLTHVDGERDDMARIQVTIAAPVNSAARCRNRWHRWRHRIDLQDAGRVDHRACHVGAVAGRVADRRPVQVERGHRKVAGVIAGANRVTEGQRIAAGAAGVARRTAIVERQRRHPAGNRHHLTHVDGERDDMARIQVTIAAPVDSAARCRNRWHRWRRGIGRRCSGASNW